MAKGARRGHIEKVDNYRSCSCSPNMARSLLLQVYLTRLPSPPHWQCQHSRWLQTSVFAFCFGNCSATEVKVTWLLIYIGTMSVHVINRNVYGISRDGRGEERELINASRPIRIVLTRLKFCATVTKSFWCGCIVPPPLPARFFSPCFLFLFCSFVPVFFWCLGFYCWFGRLVAYIYSVTNDHVLTIIKSMFRNNIQLIRLIDCGHLLPTSVDSADGRWWLVKGDNTNSITCSALWRNVELSFRSRHSTSKRYKYK